MLCYGETSRKMVPRTSNFSFFDHAFFGVADVLYLVFGLLAVGVVARTRWKFHLKWLVPVVVSNVLSLLYRTGLNAHYFLGVHWRVTAYLWIYALLYTANVVGIYGAIVLWRTLQAVVKGELPERATVATETEPCSDVWPPPPRLPSS